MNSVRALALAACLAFALAGCTDVTPAPEPEPTAPTETAPTLGSIRNPYPLGTTIEGDGWNITVHDVDLDASEAIAQANQFNPAPPSGQRYVAVRVTITRTGESAAYPFDIEVSFITAEGVGVREAAAVPAERIDLLAELQPGASITGDIPFLVHDTSVDGAVVSVIPADRSLRSYVRVEQ